MGICDDKNGPKVFIRGLHTFLVFIVVLPFLFPSSALLKRVRLGEPFSVLPVVFYISLAVSSLILYHLTCLVDPGFVPLDVSNFSDTEDEDEDEDEVYDEEKYRKSLLQRDSSLSVENKTAENDDESDYDDDMYAQHHSKKYTENESMLNNNKSSNNNTTNKNNNDGKTKLKSRFCAFCNIKQPLRAKHCEQCKRCVRKFDHHCPWLVTCVGEQNHRFFFLFLLTTLSAVVWSSYLAWQTFEMKDTPLNTVVHNCMVLVAGVVLLLGGASVMALFFIHIYLALNNLTTWEFLARHRISYLKVVEMDKNPFHLGYLKNFSVFLCSFNSQNWEAIYQKFLAKKNKIFL